MASLNDATDADIRPFILNGGKLIVWQGGSDTALSVNFTIDYMAQMQQVSACRMPMRRLASLWRPVSITARAAWGRTRPIC